MKWLRRTWRDSRPAGRRSMTISWPPPPTAAAGTRSHPDTEANEEAVNHEGVGCAGAARRLLQPEGRVRWCWSLRLLAHAAYSVQRSYIRGHAPGKGVQRSGMASARRRDG